MDLHYGSYGDLRPAAGSPLFTTHVCQLFLPWVPGDVIAAGCRMCLVHCTDWHHLAQHCCVGSQP